MIIIIIFFCNHWSSINLDQNKISLNFSMIKLRQKHKKVKEI